MSLVFLARFLEAQRLFLLVARMPTFSVRHSRFSELGFLGDGCSAQSEEPRPHLAHLGHTQLTQTAEPLGVNTCRSPQVRSSSYSLFSNVFSNWVSRVMGKCGHSGSNPMPVKAESTPGTRTLSQAVSCEIESPTAIHPIGTARTT